MSLVLKTVNFAIEALVFQNRLLNDAHVPSYVFIYICYSRKKQTTFDIYITCCYTIYNKYI